MAVGDVFYPAPAQEELTIVLSEITRISAGRTALQITIIVCNFSNIDTGYDLKVRPEGEATANKHFWRGSASGGTGQLRAGNTEIWRLHIRPGSEWVIEAAKQSGGFGDISITVSVAEMENPA
jgi:hypothetical protein